MMLPLKTNYELKEKLDIRSNPGKLSTVIEKRKLI